MINGFYQIWRFPMKFPPYYNWERNSAFMINHDKNKKTAIHEFIKDVESDLVLKNSEKQTFIRNMTIPLLYKFLKSTPSVDPLVTRTILFT